MTTEVLKQIETEVKGVADLVKDQKDATKAQFDATSGEMKNLNDKIVKQQEAIDDLMSLAQKSGVKGEAKDRCKLELEYSKKFGDYMRGHANANELKGMMNDYKSALIGVAEKNGDWQTVAELKTLSTDSLANGGALVPVRMANAIVEKQRDFSDVRKYATVERSDTTGLIFPGEANDFGFGWVGERESRTTEDGGTFYDVEIPVMEARSKVGVTNKMRMNGAFNLDAYITRKAAYRLSRGEGAAFVTGNGLKKPRGFMTYDAGTSDGQVQQITTATTTTLAHPDLTSLKTPLRSGYRPNARYFFNRFTEGAIEKLVDGQQRPLFNYGNIDQGISPRLKGYPYALLDDMDGADETTGAWTANDLVMLFGDMAEFYTIVDHTTSMLMFIDPYTGADEGKVFFRFHKFVGGGVTNFEAAKILKIKS